MTTDKAPPLTAEQAKRVGKVLHDPSGYFHCGDAWGSLQAITEGRHVVVEAGELERLRDAEAWVRDASTRHPMPEAAEPTYRCGFDVGYALAMQHALRALDAAQQGEPR